MTAPLLTTCALLLTATALAYTAWRTYHKRRAERVYSQEIWTEWHHARQWDRYPRNPDVDVRPLDKEKE